MLGALGNISPGAFVISVVLSAALSMAVFWHANKVGNKYATWWGIATFLFGGIPILIYAIQYYATRRRRY